ncbi:MAG: hypothetical protein ABIL09_22185 [Gemmatimonadota bacterium]
MVEYILGPPGICLLAFAVSVFVVARAVLRAKDTGDQLAKLIRRLDAQIREATDAIPETEGRIAALKDAVPTLKKRYVAFDAYMRILLQLQADCTLEERDEEERRRALGSQKIDMERGR